MRRERVVILVFMVVSALLFGGGGVFLLVSQRTGTAAVATVTECHRQRRAEVCTGSWTIGELTEGGQVVVGTIEGASSDDVGDTLDVRVHGGAAYTASLRLPVILLSLAVGSVVLWGVAFHRQGRTA